MFFPPCVSLVSLSQTHALRTFHQHIAACARSVQDQQLAQQRTGLGLCQGQISSPHRRAEATGHVQSKVKCSCCGHAKWVVFSKSKVISSNIWCAPPCKSSETVPCRANAFPGCPHGPQRRTQIDASRFTKCCARHEICTWRFTSAAPATKSAHGGSQSAQAFHTTHRSEWNPNLHAKPVIHTPAAKRYGCGSHQHIKSTKCVLSFQLPRLLRALKLYYKVTSSQLPAPQIAPRTPVLSFQLHRYSAY